MSAQQESQFDVFLCHNSKDKPKVTEIALKLKEKGLKPWLDEWELQPGLPWQRELEEQIQNVKSAAVFVGASGVGPWEQMEIEACLRRFVDQGCPVIPVLLPNALQQPELPLFLNGMMWVDFRRSDPEPMGRLIWGITGRKEEDYIQVDIEALLSGGVISDDLRLFLLGYQNQGAFLAYKKRLCDKGYEPGTFCLAEISIRSSFISPSKSFEEWLDFTLEAEIRTIRERYPNLIDQMTTEDIKRKIKQLLELKTPTISPLKREIFYQEYSDIFRRIILFITKNNPDKELELYPNLTYERKELVFDILHWLEEDKSPDIREWLFISIAAGLMGVDEKSTHSAASEINRKYVIPLDSEEEERRVAIKRIGEHLWKLAKTKERIDASEWLFQFLNLSKDIKIRIILFPDDYIETIFLLKFYERVILEYNNVEIDCVPRSVRCGNDAKYQDLIEVISEFPQLRSSKQFRIHDNGPKLGTVNLLKLHPSVMNILEESDFVDARGARNYEMMQGLKKDAFFGFMVCREFSESVTGLFAEDTPLVFIRQPFGERSFDGFRNRDKRIDNGRMLCSRTAKDNREKLQGGHLGNYSSWSEEERERYRVVQAFYSKNVLDFHKKYGDYLEQDVKKYLDQFRGKVLVLGCGSGKEVNYLNNKGCDVIGIDFSVEAIWLAARTLYPHLWEYFFVEDMYNLHIFQEGSYQGIVSNAVFVHLLKRSDIKVMLERMKQRLCKGGLGFIRVLDKEGIEEEYDSSLFGTVRWFVYFRCEELVQLCEQLALKVVQSKRLPHVQYPGVYWISILFKKV